MKSSIHVTYWTRDPDNLFSGEPGFRLNDDFEATQHIPLSILRYAFPIL